MKIWTPLFFGALFGVALVKADATNYWRMQDLFTFRDLHIGGVMAVAIATAALGLTLLRWKLKRSLGGAPMALKPPPQRPHALLYGAIFGAGWAVTGACPGPALAALGEGRGYALATLGGILLGTFLWGQLGGDARSSRPVTANREETRA